jgi:hypothetical protein
MILDEQLYAVEAVLDEFRMVVLEESKAHID